MEAQGPCSRTTRTQVVVRWQQLAPGMVVQQQEPGP